MTNQSVSTLISLAKLVVFIVLASFLSIAIGTLLAGSESTLTPSGTSDAGVYGYYVR